MHTVDVADRDRWDPGWRLLALAAALAMLARIVWDESNGVAVIRGEHPWEPDVVLNHLDDLREALYALAHDAWSSLVEFGEEGPVDEPFVEGIITEALAPYRDQVAAMGWSRPDAAWSEGGRR